MNRLVLIGNGFDLAHGMKTSYNDFLLWYLKKCFQTADLQRHYLDPLIEIACPYTNMSGLAPRGFGNTDELFDELYLNSDLRPFLTAGNLNGQCYGRFSAPYTINIQSKFFSKLIEKCTMASWVEIEIEFYRELKRCLVMQGTAEEQKAALGELNICMEFIVSQFEKYLLSLPEVKPIEKYRIILADPIRPSEILQTTQAEESYGVQTMLLTFNYTKTVELYSKALYHSKTGQSYEINYIHGKAGDAENPLIFGFGDELDSDYAKMENSEIKGFFKYIKSFWYFRTHNYHNLMRFLETGGFQIYTFGHSCGLSDRTMLNTIFEHPNCKSIKIFYHGTKEQNNFVAITEEISRHFKNKADMRNKIISLQYCSRMPQFNDQ